MGILDKELKEYYESGIPVSIWNYNNGLLHELH